MRNDINKSNESMSAGTIEKLLINVWAFFEIHFGQV